MGKLTTKAVEKAAPRDKEYKLHDGEGLFLRVRSSGAKSWLFSYSLPGDKRLIRMTIGTPKELNLKEARNKIRELQGLVDNGIDPRSAQAAIIAENMQAITMQVLFERWIEFEKLTQRVTDLWIKRHEDRWRLHLQKPLGSLLAKDVTRAHLSMALDAMTRKGIREETRKALSSLNLMMDYGLTRHLIDQNPARLLKPKDFAATASKPRDRVLSLLELRRLWQALEQASDLNRPDMKISAMSIVTTSAIKLLILTGARRGEIAAMRWDELNLNESVWLLPSERTKNRQAHTIYLSSLAVEIIQSLLPITGHSPFVFDTGHYRDGGHIHTDTLTGVITRLRGKATGLKKKLAYDAPLANMPSFSVHDLRRSAATAWGEYLKTEPHVIERMLNHQPLNKLVATYQRAIYAEEQKLAWQAWGEMVERQIIRKPDNVVQFMRANQ
ncbi:tyrosine-type recombinase/integrase [Legionella resiliens]|uniref:Integrase arm-type DNA-binding domain-containing protein n=1 Tax=Legionella resiliens TaxID=2905958 RepID=A0ABS8X6F8_9GAMM|nr:MULTISPECIES: site-specific integrase [unclassified Legionella]MCE0723994.1 integrase arm-type DNA-binding domain-containing protein [Legionella sp. 9fVS26]MCE3533147.1 integrase arm-type DNA-binding domain-containing protein [Legionella sp. 8cVS16]